LKKFRAKVEQMKEGRPGMAAGEKRKHKAISKKSRLDFYAPDSSTPC